MQNEAKQSLENQTEAMNQLLVQANDEKKEKDQTI